MAIPAIPTNFTVQTANQQVLIQWALTVGATSYDVVRSEDNVTFTALSTVSGSPLATSYLDTSAVLSTQYWYKVRATNSSGSSSYAVSQSGIPVPTGEMSLAEIRNKAKERADRVDSQFVTDPEWRGYINQAMFELYDLITTVYEDYSLAVPIGLTCDGTTYQFPLPNGTVSYKDLNTGSTIVPKPFYKLVGVDLALQNTNNAYVTINKFNFIDRNRFVYPNTASTIYGVFNLQYRVMGSNIQFIPTPAGGQQIRLWYVPRLTELLNDTDTTDIGISGWIEYVIVRAAKYALDKEESDSSVLTQEIQFLKARIEETAANRDEGQPDKISATRQSNYGNGYGNGWNGGTGGF